MELKSKKKRKIVYILGYGFFILFWIIVICLSLELFERLRWKHIEKTNKFVRIRKGELLIKEWDGGTEESVHYGEGKYKFVPQQLLVGEPWCYPETDPLEMWSYRYLIYFTEIEPFQSSFSDIYNIHQFRMEINQSNSELIFSPINKPLETIPHISECKTIIEQIPKSKIEAGLAFLWNENINGESLQFFFCPIHDTSKDYSYHVFLHPQKGKNEGINPILKKLAINDLWDMNYFSYIPHINSTEMPFRINNFGFRDRDFKVPKDKGVFRILCIGASTTEEGISNQETYPKFLEQELKKHFGDNRIEVFNCGVSGMVVKKHCAKLPDYLYLQPNLIILYEGINNVVYEVFQEAFDNTLLTTRIAFLLSHFVRKQMRILIPYPEDEIKSYIDRFIINYIDYLCKVFFSRNIDVCISSIGVPYRNKLNSEDRDYYDFYYEKEWGFPHSTFQQYCDVMKLYNEILKEYCKKNSVLYVPVEENIPASTKYFGDICHMRQEGIKLKAQIMAETLIPYLEKRLGLTNSSTASSE